VVKSFGDPKFSALKTAIGIDQSLTGFAMCAVDVLDVNRYFIEVYKSPYFGVQRLDDIQTKLVDFIKQSARNSPYDIAMEGTVLASHSALALGELAGLVKLTLFQKYSITPLQIPPMTLKKYATGKGTSKKQEMLMQIYKRWGQEFNDDNAADAYALARIAAGKSITDVEAAIIDQVSGVKYRDQITS
jgi:Holliday junction resolvasome RuvABC endonuclease subunit